ncbi:MAG: helix-turn-helix domain-containing protein [Acidobacteria bacterium]|nr:helix-turn-helix domain-containing protein [Acidobacteriota bacterium]
MCMELISTNEAAQSLGVTERRVRAMISDGKLPAQRIGRDYVINRSDLALVSDRKPGRPKKLDEGETTDLPAVTAAEMKAGDVVKTPAQMLARSKTKKATSGTATKSKTKAAGQGAAAVETKATKKRTAKKGK